MINNYVIIGGKKMKKLSLFITAAAITATVSVPTMAAPLSTETLKNFSNIKTSVCTEELNKFLCGNSFNTNDYIKKYLESLCGNIGSGNGNTGNNNGENGSTENGKPEDDNTGNNNSGNGSTENGKPEDDNTENDNGGNGSTENGKPEDDNTGNDNGGNGSIENGKPEDDNTGNNNGGNGNIGNNGSSSGYNEEFEQRVIELVNAERTSRGLSPLSYSSEGAQAADIRAKEIVTKFSHTRPDGSSCFTVLSQLGISYKKAGENIAYGQSSPEAVVQSWMNSQGHRENILNESYNYIGVSSYKVGSTIYWAQMFLTK
jgi:uncharacterized protein YkwD